MKARRTLRSLGEGGERLQRILQNTPQLAAGSFIVQVDEVGQFQWPDGGFQEVTLAKGEWAGPIQLPGD